MENFPRIEAKVNAITPALSGYFVVYPIWHDIHSDRIESLYYEPVIAWALQAEYVDGYASYTTATPVCVDSECIQANHLIQYPDGNLIDQNNVQSLMDLPPKSSMEYEERIKKHFLDLKNEQD